MFRYAFTFVNIMTLVSAVIISYYSIETIEKNGVKQNAKPIEMSTFLSFIGFSCYNFSGAVCLLPIMEASEVKAHFDKIFIACMAFITILWGVLGTLTFLAYGPDQS